ncbi:YchJ family protein [Flavobacterium soli]|uniref:YchJ family protein n=1 Tax=Flavobacterium soli TaxID=344881 RepID=UPI000407152F|nr:YchJ family metal-binding protein [Flavobacterium soli]
MPATNCYCGNEKPFATCCEPYIKNVQKAPTAEALMRSRYSAYCIVAGDYLVATTHPSTRKFHDKASILEWSKSNQWLKLEVMYAEETVVEFKAFFLDAKLKANVHHEKSRFEKEDGSWLYVDGVFY